MGFFYSFAPEPTIAANARYVVDRASKKTLDYDNNGWCRFCLPDLTNVGGTFLVEQLLADIWQCAGNTELKFKFGYDSDKKFFLSFPKYLQGEDFFGRKVHLPTHQLMARIDAFEKRAGLDWTYIAENDVWTKPVDAAVPYLIHVLTAIQKFEGAESTTVQCIKCGTTPPKETLGLLELELTGLKEVPDEDIEAVFTPEKIESLRKYINQLAPRSYISVSGVIAGKILGEGLNVEGAKPYLPERSAQKSLLR